ncbi:hypothetical protein [Methylobacterium trifolii]|uniref:Uncharacterized protein n=1 Tax=Methylobacterium trifolii TaxID=1003092 RepID=A0ABQ4U6B1_9HYPH|nr:hypothetical protein [Methylobacterium trifolii]GJE61695.1 hypothetical protein MPOCJGCO_3818 [Methylobacterium trifolii]
MIRSLRFLVATAALLVVVLPLHADQILAPARIDNSSKIVLPGGPTLGLWSGGKYTSQPDALQIKGTGSSGDVSGMSVTPSSGAASGSLAKLLEAPTQFDGMTTSGALLSRLFAPGPLISEAPSGKAGILRLGGANPDTGKDWLETEIPYSSSIAQGSVLALKGRIGLLGASRTSDNTTTPGAQGTQGVAGFCLNDNATVVSSCYGFYGEARRKSGAGFTHLFEGNTINQGSVVPVTPYGVAQGATFGYWSSCGRGDLADSAACSAAYAIVNNGVNGGNSVGSPWLTGIHFGCNSIQGVDCTGAGTGAALQMTPGHLLKWMSSTGGQATFGSTVTTDAAAQNLRFTNSGLLFSNSAGNPLFTVNTNTNLANGLTLTPGPVGTPPILTATGADATIPFIFRTSGTAGSFDFQNGAGAEAFKVSPVASGVNYVLVTGATTTISPSVTATGSDTNVNLSMGGKGTGQIVTTSSLRITPSQTGAAGGITKLDLWNGGYGFGVSSSALDYVAPAGAAHTFYVGGAAAVKITSTGVSTPSVAFTATTVAALPTCNAGTQDTIRAVSDATAPTYRGALTGGGTIRTPVYCDGTSWTAH